MSKEYNYNAQYRSEVSKFTKKDAIIALCFYAFYILAGIALGIYRRFFEQTLLVSILFGVLVVGVCFLIVFVRKEGLASLGIRRKNLWPSLRLGLLFGPIPLIIYSFTLHLVFGWEFRPIVPILISVLNILMFAVGEDILFVGYIQTRMYGLIKKDIWAICVVALLFTLMHFPILIVQHGAGVLAAIGGFSGGLIWFVSLFIAHVVFNAVFRRYAVLFPTVMLHTVNNVSSNGSVWVVQPPFWVVTLYFSIIALALIVWTLWLRRRDKKSIAV